MAETWHGARLKVDFRREGDIAIIDARGECDLITSRKLKEAADSLFDEGRCKIIFDLQEMNYIDSSGFRVLLEAKNRATEMGGDVALVSLAPPVERVYTLLRLHELVMRTDTVDEAIKALAPLECR
jgi:anti-anti-sigma factor